MAVATNVFALTFMSIGGSLPFLGCGLDRSRFPKLAVVTLLRSALGALLLQIMPPTAIRAVVSFAVIAVAVFSLVSQDAIFDVFKAPRAGGNTR